jgi:hypothetical protein
MTEEQLKDLQNFKELIRYFKQLSDDGVSSAIEKSIIQMLDSTIPFFAHLVLEDEFAEIHRLTINKRVLGENKRIRDIKYLKYPPADMVSKYGRCNYPHQSVLYSSFLGFTAMNESQPRVGDLITESKWRLKKNQTLVYCPIFKNQPLHDVVNIRTLEINKIFKRKLKEYPKFEQEKIDVLVQFIADAFTKIVNPNNHYDYIFSSYFSNKIFNDFENGTIEAIYYPSVKERLSFENLAIKPDVFDKKYELIEVKDSVCQVDVTNGRGGYFFQGLSDCKSFDYASGKILWDKEKIYQSARTLENLKSNYGVNIEV